MYHLPVYESLRHATAKHIYLFLFSLPELWRKKKWNLQSSALDKLSPERCLLPHHYVPCYCAALFSSFYFIIFMLVFNVKLRKETDYDINRSLRWARRFIYAWRLHDALFSWSRGRFTPDGVPHIGLLGVLIPYPFTRFVLNLISLILHSFLS